MRSTTPPLLRSQLFLFVLSTALVLGLATGASAEIIVDDSGSEMVFVADGPYGGIVLTVEGPDCQEVEVRTDEIGAKFSLFDDEGKVRPDGVYIWQVNALPDISSALAKDLQAARAEGDTMFAKKLIDQGVIVSERVSGAFTIADGRFVYSKEDPKDDKDPGSKDAHVTEKQASASDLGLPEKQIINGDAVVYNSMCVGFDCPNNPAFSFDTIRLQENNLRIHFDDTSTAGSYPRADWRIAANDSSNGGASYFAIQDADANRTVFQVTDGAPSNALVVDANGDVGIGTANATTEIHAVDGDTPTLRLDQDGSSGFQPQVWDIAGNETSFFVRDASNGSTLPFRIRPGAPSNRMVLTDNGVGIDILSPESALHVKGTSDDTYVYVENSNAASATREVFVGENNGPPRFSIENTSSGDKWFVGQNGTGALTLSKDGTASNELRLNGLDAGSNPGRATFQGDVVGTVFVNSSSRDIKTAIQSVDVSAVLAKVLDLEIAEWQYRRDPSTVRHIGPMAQDFAAAFALGDGDQHIATVDADGVALAAIQGLAAQVETLEAQNALLLERLAALEERLQD